MGLGFGLTELRMMDVGLVCRLAMRLSLMFSVILATTVLSTSAIAGGVGATRPNILLILVDDLRPELGVYGAKLAHTPNLDRLAARSLVLDRAYAQVPVCGASRASLLSGRKPTTSRFLTYNSRLDQDLPDAPSLPAWFQNHGYRTLANGKVFDVSADSAGGWTEPLWNPQGDWRSSVPRATRHEDLQKAYREPLVAEVGPAWERVNVPDDAYPDGKVADKTVADLRRLARQHEPFFLAMGLRKPHLPFTAPTAYWRDLPSEEDLPPSWHQRPLKVAPLAIHNSPELRLQYSGIPTKGLLESHKARELIQAYLAAVTYADAQIGKVMDALEESGLAANTVVVVAGDHGWNLGEHTLWTKHSLFEVTLRVPLLIAVPETPGVRSRALVDLLDLYPTLVGLSGLPVPPGLDGRSLTPLFGEPDGTVKTQSISRWFDGESIRTDRYRYTQWHAESGAVRERMLYDLQEDPHEMRNLVGESSMTQRVADLSARLAADRGIESWAPFLKRVIEARDRVGR